MGDEKISVNRLISRLLSLDADEILEAARTPAKETEEKETKEEKE